MSRKGCTGCGLTKALEDFHRHSGRADGRASACKDCAKERAREWRRTNVSRHRQNARTWRLANPEAAQQKDAEHRKQNRERRREDSRRWYRRNKALTMLRATTYRALRKSVTLWNDPRIAALYEIAVWLRSKGDDVHVDHITPLQPADRDAPVGLHVYCNLQILPAVENLRKGNR